MNRVIGYRKSRYWFQPLHYTPPLASMIFCIKRKIDNTIDYSDCRNRPCWKYLRRQKLKTFKLIVVRLGVFVNNSREIKEVVIQSNPLSISNDQKFPFYNKRSKNSLKRTWWLPRNLWRRINMDFLKNSYIYRPY